MVLKQQDHFLFSFVVVHSVAIFHFSFDLELYVLASVVLTEILQVDPAHPNLYENNQNKISHILKHKL